MQPRLASDWTGLKSHYDVVVIGSGYGGGVAAARFARAGKSVCVLERGREIQPGEFPEKFPDLRKDMQVRGGRVDIGPASALFDVRVGDDMHVLVGCGLGGGSLINAGVALRPDPRVFKDAAWPDAIRAGEGLDECYARARRWLKPARDPRARERGKFQALERASVAIVVAPVLPEITARFEAGLNAVGDVQPACTGCGDCCGGCNVGAKTTVAATYLTAAKRDGAALFTHASVRHVAKAADGWSVHFARNDGARGAAAEITVSAAIVVVAAGALGSTEIMLRSRERGLAVSDRLGERFSANGDIIAFGYGAKSHVGAVGVGHPAKVEGMSVGAAVSGQIEIRDAGALDRELTVQEGAVPSALAPMLPVLFLPNGRLLGALQSLVSGVYKGPFQGLQTFFCVSHDEAAGRMRLVDDVLKLSWPNAGEQRVYRDVDATLAKLVGALGGSYVKNPLAGTVMGHQPATAHPLGGCGMGDDRATGVIDHKCRVFDPAGQGSDAVHDGLYVIDGSIMARSLGCNPLLTITAFAERAMMLAAADLGLSGADSQ